MDPNHSAGHHAHHHHHHHKNRKTKKTLKGGDEASISQFRNQDLAKNAEKQMKFDEQQMKDGKPVEKPGKSKEKPKEKSKERAKERAKEKAKPILAGTTEKSSQQTTKFIANRKVKPAGLAEVVEAASQQPITTEPKRRRKWDGVVFVIFVTEFLAALAFAMELHVFLSDQQWNRIAEGEEKIDDLPEHEAFRDKTYELDKHHYLRKAKEYSLRNDFQEIIFLVLIVGFLILSLLHLFGCYLPALQKEKTAAVLIFFYAIGGAVCIFSSTFLVSAATNIENNYAYSADMLYNFQHVFDDHIGANNSNGPECIGPEFVKGCDSYEYSKVQAYQLEHIFRICGEGSRYTRYYQSTGHKKETVEIQGELYSRPDLKKLNFCSRDGFKYAAALFAIFAGVMAGLVPIVFCCDVKAPHEVDEDEPKPADAPFDARAAIEQFKTYVEKDSDDDEKYAKKKGREKFEFKTENDKSSEKSDKSSRKSRRSRKSDKSDKTEKSEKSGRSRKSDKSEKTEKSDRSEKSEKSDKTEKSGKR